MSDKEKETVEETEEKTTLEETTSEETEDANVQDASETVETEVVDESEELKKKVADLEGQIAKLKNAYAMAYADTENTKKRLQKDFEQLNKYKLQSFASEILPVLDNCERALAVKPKDSEDENYRRAFEMVLKQLTTALKKEGVEEIDALNKEYDANLMQAMMMEHVDGVEPNMVTAVLQKGYLLKDRLLRAAMVKVSE